MVKSYGSDLMEKIWFIKSYFWMEKDKVESLSLKDKKNSFIEENIIFDFWE